MSSRRNVDVIPLHGDTWVTAQDVIRIVERSMKAAFSVRQVQRLAEDGTIRTTKLMNRRLYHLEDLERLLKGGGFRISGEDPDKVRLVRREARLSTSRKRQKGTNQQPLDKQS